MPTKRERDSIQNGKNIFRGKIGKKKCLGAKLKKINDGKKKLLVRGKMKKKVGGPWLLFTHILGVK